jgi:hypothetical protein
MTDPTHERIEAEESRHREWLDEAQGALDRTTSSLRAAWDATRDTRVSALESAKKAVQELGDAIDRGVDVAKERWDAGKQEASAESEEE